MKRTKVWIRIRQSFWFLPAIYGVAGLIGLLITITIDLSISQKTMEAGPSFLVTDRSITKEMFSAFITSILTMTTVTFSTIMVVLTTFTSQFSPRALQDFIADNATQRVLAIFVFGVIYSLFALFTLQPGDQLLIATPISGVLIVSLCIAAFVYFINHVSKWVQVNNLVNKLGNQAMLTIHHVNKGIAELQDGHKGYSGGQEDFQEPGGKAHVITAENGGYIALIDYDAFLKMTEKDDIQCNIHVHVGDFVLEGTNLLTYWAGEGQTINELYYKRLIKLETERTGIQDIEFGIQKLVEITLRAISPSVNDPHTAINSINRIGTLLLEITKREYLSSYLYDRNGQWRVKIIQFDFDHYLYKAFYQIRYYASDDVSVTTSIIYVLKLLVSETPSSMHKDLVEFAKYIYNGFHKNVLLKPDEAYFHKQIDELAEVTGESIR